MYQSCSDCPWARAWATRCLLNDALNAPTLSLVRASWTVMSSSSILPPSKSFYKVLGSPSIGIYHGPPQLSRRSRSTPICRLGGIICLYCAPPSPTHLVARSRGSRTYCKAASNIVLVTIRFRLYRFASFAFASLQFRTRNETQSCCHFMRFLYKQTAAPMVAYHI